MSSSALCPLCCGLVTRKLLSLEFSEKQHLPKRIDLNLCAACNFAFASPRDTQAYDAFYGTTLNAALGADLSLTESEKREYASQIDALQSVLQQHRPLRILDIGCGQAGLLRMLNARYPNNHYHAADPNVDAKQKSASGIQFSHTWKDIKQKFDLIILSHVVEHVVDFAEFTQLPALLTEGGHVYIEVPDATHYQSYARQEYLYYFDRLHINHFTHEAMSVLAARWGLAIGARGRSVFEYKDGRPYPAIYVLATEGRQVSDAPSTESLADSLLAYIKGEADRSRGMREDLRAGGPIVAYGFGDNFFKAIGADGPLAEAQIAVVIDRRHALLNQSPYASRYTFMDIDACCAQYPDATYVIAISWGSEQVRSELQRRGIQNIKLI